jgi:hypothetical protein
MPTTFVPVTEITFTIAAHGTNPVSLPGSMSIPLEEEGVETMAHLTLFEFELSDSKINPTALAGGENACTLVVTENPENEPFIFGVGAVVTVPLTGMALWLLAIVTLVELAMVFWPRAAGNPGSLSDGQFTPVPILV